MEMSRRIPLRSPLFRQRGALSTPVRSSTLFPPLSWVPRYIRSMKGNPTAFDQEAVGELPYSLKGDFIAGLTVGFDWSAWPSLCLPGSPSGLASIRPSSCSLFHAGHSASASRADGFD